MNGPITETANFVAVGQVEFEAYDYGTNYQVGATLYLTSSSGAQYSDPSWTTITIPVGTYSLSYSNSQYGAGVYAPAQSPIYVSQGQTALVDVVYYTPTSISENVRVYPSYVGVSGQVTTADGGNVGANYYVIIKVTFSSGETAKITVSTDSNGDYSGQVRWGYPWTSATITVDFDPQGGFLQSSNSQSVNYPY